ncbi:WxL protein peptidoglycan domain-containing protein [Microbacterium dextranolyticum]|uniref:DUF916 domain-containing protein n=1 Tax=Microbacterium dextranolyticum TaxID=36806 RepID=A0A9W6HLS5_9MICO|nr:DUF916 domain-containing protein [Microbacterium dextranolyticum]MBM7463878.1 putative membrane protein [Microbacterium dextranolyticum]GLJ94960.1 hypothetical protein GCM10017591_10220 [Microbacterium dextranolyticum]
MIPARLSRLVPAVLAAGILVVTALATPPAALADDAGGAGANGAGSTTDVTWTVRTDANGYGKERTSYSYAIDPGQSISDALVVANHGADALQLSLYAADGYTGAGGQLDLLTPADRSVGIGAWTHSDAATVTVPAGESVTVPFTVVVPASATPGDYVGGIVTSLSSSSDQGISVDRRLGIRMALRVSGALAPALTIENPHVAWGGTWSLGTGAATFGYTLHNTGNTTLGAQQTASVAGPFGWFPTDAAEVAPEVQILPGETRDVSVEVPGIVGMLALIASATVTPVVVDAAGSTTTMAPTTVQAVGLAVPWLLLIIVLVVAALAFGAVRLRRRRAASRRRTEDERVARAVAEALAEARTADDVVDEPATQAPTQ